MRRSAELSVEALPGKMKSIFFSLSLLLLLEKQAAGIGIYGECREPPGREALRENVHEGVLAVRRTLHGVIFLMDSESSPPTSTCLWERQWVDGGNSGIDLKGSRKLNSDSCYPLPGGTKGHFLVKTSPLVFIDKGQFLYGHREEQEEAPEESILVQTKHHVYSQDADADTAEAHGSQKQTGLKEDIVCDEEDELAQQKSQLKSQSQIKSQTQVKSHEAQVKSQTGQLKTAGQVKSQTKLKSHGASLKFYKAPLHLQKDVSQQQIKGRGYDLHQDLPQVRQQHANVHRLKRKLGQSSKTVAFLPIRHRFQPYHGYFMQFQEHLHGSVHHTKSFHHGPGMCYCPNGGLMLYQGTFTE
ncbi:seminal vesicle secretory protein 3B isoform X1 [Rattus norvegicus]